MTVLVHVFRGFCGYHFVIAECEFSDVSGDQGHVGSARFCCFGKVISCFSGAGVCDDLTGSMCSIVGPAVMIIFFL